VQRQTLRLPEFGAYADFVKLCRSATEKASMKTFGRSRKIKITKMYIEESK
jgi:hypothetical protein